jgi:hypothetical protein
MTVTNPPRSSSTTLGWLLIAAVGAMLILSAAWLFTSVGTPAVFEADTGVSASEFTAAYPSVARELDARGRTIAMLVGALAVLALTAAASGWRAHGWRTGASALRPTLWAFAAVLAAVGTVSTAGGRADVGSFYLLLGAITGLAVQLVRRPKATP